MAFSASLHHLAVQKYIIMPLSNVSSLRGHNLDYVCVSHTKYTKWPHRELPLVCDIMLYIVSYLFSCCPTS
jgi:hypothetical protein